MRQIILWPVVLFTGLLSALFARRPARQSDGFYTTFNDYAGSAEILRGWLHDQGLPAPTERFQGGGGGSVRSRGRVIIDSGGCGGGASIASETGSVTAGVGQGHSEIGLILLEAPLVRVYTLGGISVIGGGALAHTCDENRAPVRHEAPVWGVLLLHGGLGIDFKLRLGRLELFAGVRMGNRIGLLSLQSGGDYLAPPEGAFVRGATGARWLSRD